MLLNFCFSIRSDHNADNTLDVLKTWIDKNKNDYNLVDYVLDEDSREHTDGLFEWSTEHFKHLIKLKENAISAARKMWADYIFVSKMLCIGITEQNRKSGMCGLQRTHRGSVKSGNPTFTANLLLYMLKQTN